MGIPGENLPMLILLLELQLQCDLLERSVRNLQAAADSWKSDTEHGMNNIDVVSQCIVALSAAASIARLVELGDRKGKKHVITRNRCKALRQILGYPALVEIKKIGTRNSWEHMDERLDEIFKTSTYTSFSPIHVSARPPTPDTFVHYQFDPVTLAIKHRSDSLRLGILGEECRDLREAITYAMQALHRSTRNPYSVPDSE